MCDFPIVREKCDGTSLYIFRFTIHVSVDTDCFEFCDEETKAVLRLKLTAHQANMSSK